MGPCAASMQRFSTASARVWCARAMPRRSTVGLWGLVKAREEVVLLCCLYCQALLTPFFFPLFYRYVDHAVLEALSQFSCEAIWGMLSPCSLWHQGRESDDGD